MAQAYYPRGQRCDLVIMQQEFYEMFFEKKTVVDGTVRARAMFSDRSKLEVAVKKMLSQGTSIRRIIQWTVPENMTYSELALDTKKYNEAQIDVIDEFLS